MLRPGPATVPSASPNAQALSMSTIHSAVLGHAIAQKLFPFVDPMGREVRVDGRDFEVIGVFDEKKSAFGSGFDNYILIPVTTFIRAYGMVQQEGFRRSVNITVRARTPELMDDAVEQTRLVLRHDRGLGPGDEDDFAFFSSATLIREFNELSLGVKIAAFVIGTIALIVAGIGIMNIMLASVTERTREIGVRKALGAKPAGILAQFLLEAVILCNFGGILGAVVGYGMGNLICVFTDFEMKVPLEWAIIGLLFCSAVGVCFGMLPALRASRLHPVDALRWE